MKRIFCTVMFLLFSTVTAWGLTGTLEEWDTSPLRPYDIAVLDDGSPWLTLLDTENPGGKIFTLDPSTGLAIPYDSGLTPALFEGLDRSIDNTLWIADNEDRIVHFDPSDFTFLPYPLPVDIFGESAIPTAVKVAPDGSVWFANYLDRSLGRLDQGTGDFERFPTDTAVKLPDKPNQIDFSDDGTVWFTVGHAIAHLLCSLNPDTGVIESWSDADFRTPFGINVVGDKVWFLDHQADILVQFDPSTETFRKFPTPPELDDAHFFVVDADSGIFWMTAFVGDHIGTFNPTTETFDTLAVASGSNPMGIALSPTGEVWWAETFDHLIGGVGRFTPSSAIEVPVDIKPMSCPNPLNVKDRGVLPVAILGTSIFDVTQIDPASIELAGVSPLRWSWEDVATSAEDGYNEDGGDGYLDLVLKFDTQEVIAALGEVEDGQEIPLSLTGNLMEEYGSTPIMGEDVVIIVKKGMN